MKKNKEIKKKEKEEQLNYITISVSLYSLLKADYEGEYSKNDRKVEEPFVNRRSNRRLLLQFLPSFNL